MSCALVIALASGWSPGRLLLYASLFNLLDASWLLLVCLQDKRRLSVVSLPKYAPECLKLAAAAAV